MESLSGVTPCPKTELGPWESEACGDSRAAPPFHTQEIFTTQESKEHGAGRGGGEREFEATGSAGVCGEECVDRHGKTGQAAGMRHILGTPSTGVFF